MSILGAAIIGGLVGMAGIGANVGFGRQQQRREDQAFSRAAADLEAAGLSKTLAAGQPIGSTPIQAGSGFQDMAKAVKEMPMVKAQVDHQKAQDNLLDQQTQNARTEQQILRNNAWISELDGVQKQWYQDWLLTGKTSSMGFRSGEQSRQVDMLTKKWEQDLQQDITQQRFYNRLGLPNEPGVLNSQAGQTAIFLESWKHMDEKERGILLAAYGADTIGDIIKALTPGGK